MKKLFSSLLCAILVLTCCTTPEKYLPKTKIVPEFTGIDPVFKRYVDEYMFLAELNGIKFFNPVTIGLTDVDDGNAVGVCWRTPFWREIEIDRFYWSHATAAEKVFLMFHELTHCYCGREHDYNNGKSLYPEVSKIKLFNIVKSLCSDADAKDGYFTQDGCPISVMVPTVTTDYCMRKYYPDYVKEMFDRCSPW